MSGGEQIDRETIADALDEVAPVHADYGTDFMKLTREEMTVWGPDEGDEEDGWVVTADASSRLAQEFAFQLGDALPGDYFVEVGRLGSFHVCYSTEDGRVLDA